MADQSPAAAFAVGLLTLRYGSDCNLLPELRSALQTMDRDEAICVVGLFPTPEALFAHCQQHSNRLAFWDLDCIRAGPGRRWLQYSAYVERQVRGDDDEANAQASVFGNCRRCGSARVTVRTRQLRRADEGATELRTCRDCGHVTRVNS
jgi:DNA-directed RNA polymerase subunit M/transcription elongation factor TFIIS